MKLFKGIGTASCLVVLCLVVAPGNRASGQQPGNSVVTFAVPVEVPGVSAQILPAGTYRFMALDSTPDRDIIQISSADGSHVFTTMLGVPNARLNAPDLITVVFSNRPAADPLALKAWYYPGRAWGDQLVYEKPRATQLAKEMNEPVLSTSVVQAMSSEAVLKSALIEAVGPGGETVALSKFVDAPGVIEGSTAATASAPAAQPAAATETTLVAGPGVAAQPVSAPAQTIASEPAVATTPSSVIDPAATSATPATADLAAASAPTPVGEPVVKPAPSVAVAPNVAVAPAEPAVAAAPVAPTLAPEPAVASSHEVAAAALPATASLLPLIGLVGLLLLGAGFLLTNLMKRRV